MPFQGVREACLGPTAPGRVTVTQRASVNRRMASVSALLATRGATVHEVRLAAGRARTQLVARSSESYGDVQCYYFFSEFAVSKTTFFVVNLHFLPSNERAIWSHFPIFLSCHYTVAVNCIEINTALIKVVNRDCYA